MNLDKSNTATPLGTDKIVINRQDIAEYTCTLEKLSDYVESNIPAPTPFTLPYKSYVAIMNQVDIYNPVATIVYNDLGNIVWTRDGTGIYAGILTGAFTQNKTFCILAAPQTYTVPGDIIIQMDRNSNNVISLLSLGPSGAADWLLDNQAIEIRVYN
jgi:hypothetical protein